MKPRVRVSTKAIIIQAGKILMTKNQDAAGIYYMLPGGGQNLGERLDEALKRECIEEVGVRVRVHELGFVRDYIAKNHKPALDIPDPFHQLELFFYCSLVEGEVPGPGTAMDNAQIGVEWMELNKLKDHRIYPTLLFNYIRADFDESTPVYLGDIN